MLVSKINGLISLAAGRLFEFIPIKGINSGRGSYSAITNRLLLNFSMEQSSEFHIRHF